MASQTIENYLKAIYLSAHPGGTVTTSELAEALGVRLPTVNSMVKRLGEKGLVKYEKYKPLMLTEAGVKQAAQIVRRHRLTEMYLVERMGFGWEEVHDIAEQIEHIKAQPFFDRMDELLDFPKFDPHGSPIPDKDGNIPVQNLHILSAIDAGKSVTLKALSQSSEEFLLYLNSKKLSLETTLEVLEKEAFDGSVIVAYNGQQVTLSKQVSDRLLVEA
ncbi:MAG: metal-dependent transcriptional regulator [Flavobacteriales bacterium]